jgi:GNAT superfamily N-acetyltransferase
MSDFSEHKGGWIGEENHIEKFNDIQGCLCGEKDEELIFKTGRFHEHWFCDTCRSRYLIGNNGVIEPENILKTNIDGLTEATEEFKEELELLMEMSWEVYEYIEFHPLGSYGKDEFETYLFARDGLFLGCLIYGPSSLRAVIVASGFRRQGVGTEMVETWYEEEAEMEIVDVMSYDSRKPFFRQLSFPVSFE